MRIMLRTIAATLLLLMGLESVAAETAAEKKDPIHIYRSAGVNAEQEAKIRQLAQEYDKAGRVRVERLRNLSKQIKDLSYDAELDEVKILAIQSEINEIQAAINTERTKLMLKIRSMLSGDQKEKLVDLMREKDPQAPPKRSNVGATPDASSQTPPTSPDNSSSSSAAPAASNSTPAPSPAPQ